MPGKTKKYVSTHKSDSLVKLTEVNSDLGNSPMRTRKVRSNQPNRRKRATTIELTDIRRAFKTGSLCDRRKCRANYTDGSSCYTNSAMHLLDNTRTFIASRPVMHLVKLELNLCRQEGCPNVFHRCSRRAMLKKDKVTGFARGVVLGELHAWAKIS